MINDYLIYIGLKEMPQTLFKVEESESNEIPNIKKVYRPSTDIKVAERYLNYLKEIHDYQRDRRTNIENKNSQLVGQASIVTSIFSLFIPLLIDSLNDVSMWIKIPLSVLFLVVLFHYLLSILHAIKTLTVDKYKYPSRSTMSVTKDERMESEIDFINSEVEDLVYIINNTIPIDNIKGANLVFGARCFKIGNIGFGLMTFLVIISTFILNKETDEVNIGNLKDLNFKMPDTINTRIIDLKIEDTLSVNIDSVKNNIYQLGKNGVKKKY